MLCKNLFKNETKLAKTYIYLYIPTNNLNANLNHTVIFPMKDKNSILSSLQSRNPTFKTRIPKN